MGGEARPTGRHDIGGIVRTVGKPWCGGDDEFGGRRIQPSGPPGEGAVGNNRMVALGHQPNLVVGMPRLGYLDENVRAGRLEFLLDGVDIVGENVERHVRIPRT